jgi:TldD protein
VDDPAKPWFGHEEVDEEGVPELPLTLVEKGVLKDFLRTRQPVRGYDESNGRARINGSYGADTPVPTNLIVTAREKSSITDLKKKLIDLIQQRGLPYGMIVRKLDFPSSASIDEARKILSAAGAGSSKPLSIPLYAYRLYPDGREELVRGERFKGVNARSLKDILAAGDDSVTFNYLDNGAPFALLGYGSGAAEVTVVAPSVLVDDLELSKVDDELPKLPIVPSPSGETKTAALK